MSDLSEAGGELKRYLAERGARFPTGFSVDEHGCLGRGEQGIICARSSGGKSALVLNIISRTPAIPTVFFTLEMPRSQCILWLTAITYQLGFHADELEEAISDEWHLDHERANIALGGMPTEYPHLYLRDANTLRSLADLRHECDRIYAETGVQPRRVFVDHFGLLSDGRDYETTIRSLNQAKAWAKNDDIAVVLLQQGTKAGDGAGSNDGHLPVTLSSGVWGDGSSADFMWGLYRPSLNKKYADPKHAAEYEAIKNESRFSVVKNRATGVVDLRGVRLTYDPSSRRLYEVGRPNQEAHIRRVPGDEPPE